MTSGIYKITNKENGKCYIGLAHNIIERWSSHQRKYMCETGKEYDKALYRALRKYGIQGFTWEVLEYCEPELLAEKEIYWIEKEKAYANGYNETIGGDIGGFDRNGELHPNHKLTEKDVINIRTRYNNRERKNEVYLDYNNCIGNSGFDKIWKGETWKLVMPEVYSKENRDFHSNNTGNKGSKNGRSRLTEEDVYNMRLRRKNGDNIRKVYEDYQNLITYGSFTNVWTYQNWKNIIV